MHPICEDQPRNWPIIFLYGGGFDRVDQLLGGPLAGVFGGAHLGTWEDVRELADTVELMSSYWINFTENGDPNAEGLPEWPEFDEKEQQVMVINGESGARKHPNLEKLMAFDAYYAKLRESMKTE